MSCQRLIVDIVFFPLEYITAEGKVLENYQEVYVTLSFVVYYVLAVWSCKEFFGLKWRESVFRIMLVGVIICVICFVLKFLLVLFWASLLR